jgi:hypothetical protein
LEIDLGEGLTLEMVTHPKKDTTRFLIKRNYKVPSDGSEVKIRYVLIQDSVQIGSRSKIVSVSYELAAPTSAFQIGRFASITTETFVRGVFEKGSPFAFDISVVGSLLGDGSDETYVAEAVFKFGADGLLDGIEWLASGSRIEVSRYSDSAPWKPFTNLLFRAVFNRELGELIGLSPDLVQEIARSAARKESLDIAKLLSFAPKRGSL